MAATGNNYAEALFMLAHEENNIDVFFKDLKMVENVFRENTEYLQFLATPSISKSERTTAVLTAFDGKINEHVLSFLQLLCEHGKAESFFECVEEYSRLREYASGTATAVVKTAVELNDSQKQSLIKELSKRTGKTISLKCVVDATLLGGIVVELEGQLLDGSVKNNLKHAREVITE